MKLPARAEHTVEPLLLFSVLFLPGYLAQTTTFNSRLLVEVSFNLYYLLVAVPQVLLLVYLSRRGQGYQKNSYGYLPLRHSDVVHALLVFCGVSLCAGAVAAVSKLAGDQSGFLGDNLSHAAKPSILPLVFLSAMATGYREELFFRSYLLNKLPQAGLSLPLSTAVSALLFGAGHLYEGIPAFLGTVLIAVFLSFYFIKFRNLHAVAIGHGLYNFLVLSLSLFQGGASW